MTLLTMLKPRFIVSLALILSLSTQTSVAFSATESELNSSSGTFPTLVAKWINSVIYRKKQAFTREVSHFSWISDTANKLVDKMPLGQERIKLLQEIQKCSLKYDLESELILAVIQVESNFDRLALSIAGAQGYMQVMPFWLAELNRPYANLFETENNIDMGCAILRHYLDIENGDMHRALARYNGSLGRDKYPDKVFSFYESYWRPDKTPGF